MSKTIGLKEAMAIGIGGMVGGGIFAVLGLAVSLAKGGTPIAFLFAGIIALLTSYSYVKLSLTYPDRGGTVKFINTGFGRTVFSGAMNNLLWVSYVIMLALYASAFGSYAPNLLQMWSKSVDFHVYASGVVVLATLINYYSVKVVGRIETVAVVIKLIILLLFVVIGLYGLGADPNLEQLSFTNWESPIKMLTGGMVIFVAYEGFELIANAVPDIEDPKKNIPRAYYYSVVFVICLYVIIAIVTVGSLPFEKISTAQDYVLAEAAKPMLGQVGFTVITIAALISTFSAINASLYGGTRVSYELAQDDELPSHLMSKLWNQPIGLLITTIATLLMVNLVELESISTAGSLGFLLIFAIVNYIGYKRAAEIQGNRYIPLLGSILCAMALVALCVQQFQDNLAGVIIAGSIIALCFMMEWFYKRSRSGHG